MKWFHFIYLFINFKHTQMKIWSSHLLDNLSNCLMNLKNSGDSTGFEPMTSAVPVQCSNQQSYEVTQLRSGQFVGLRSWIQIPLSHLNFSGSWGNCLNCPASARIISSFDFKHRTSYNTFLSYDIPFTGKHEPNKLTCSQLCDFIAQLVRALHRHRRGHGFESRWVTWIFQVHETIS